MPRAKRLPSSQPDAVDARHGRTQAVFYRDRRGKEPVNDFLEALFEVQPLAVAKIDDAIEEHLNGRDPRHPPPEFPATSQIEGELRELRVRFAKTRYRVLYQRSRNLVVLLHVFEKNTGMVVARDRNTAQARMADFEVRMNASPRRRPRAAGRDAPPGREGRDCTYRS
ncbi:MAG TPA: type II toxin-antitoxin system RelE/ParE family toxin [Solirubrobacteraceae bacterium]|nr:type II toxin-antitoxin system RelE/ParE family toxin [Solirubrobacteraceae bacterium]